MDNRSFGLKLLIHPLADRMIEYYYYYYYYCYYELGIVVMLPHLAVASLEKSWVIAVVGYDVLLQVPQGL